MSDEKTDGRAEDILLGYAVDNGDALTANRKLFGHMHVRGMTGSGKTSLSLIPLTIQFMEPYEDD